MKWYIKHRPELQRRHGDSSQDHYLKSIHKQLITIVPQENTHLTAHNLYYEEL